MKRSYRLILACFAAVLLGLPCCGADSPRKDSTERKAKSSSWVRSPKPASKFAKKHARDKDEDILDEYEEEYGQENNGIADPLRPWNKIWFHFNDKTYFWLIKPVSKGYGMVLPRFLRKGVKNALDNLGFPARFVNNTLQGRLTCAETELGRFVLNTTIGVGGLWDPGARILHMKPCEADFDQTLGN